MEQTMPRTSRPPRTTGPARPLRSSGMITPALLLPAMLLVVQFVAAGPAAADDSFEKQLRAAGVEPDAGGIEDYLRSFLPGDDETRKAEALIAKLGSRDFHEREDATQRLASMPEPPLASLKKAAESPDAETRWRARRILDRTERGDHRGTLMAALETIRNRPIEGLAPTMIELFPVWDDPYLLKTARQALAATARVEDATALRKAIRESNRNTRVAAVAALAAVLADDAENDLVELLEDGDEHVRVAAARGLADRGHRASLPVLGELLDSGDREVRTEAGSILRAFTGQKFGYLAYDEPGRRAAAVKDWTAWIETHGATAKLHFPLKETGIELGRTLICVWAEKKLIELDASGKEVFEAGGYAYIWGCDGLPNGHRVAVDYNRQCVIEYDAQGKEIWRKDGLPGKPTSVERLTNGNTLLALSDSGLVVEVNRGGEIVWQVRLAGRPTLAQRLENGLTVVNLQFAKKVVEIDRDGNVVWELTGLNNPLNSERLESGNVLVCEMSQNKIVEYDRAGKIVWSKEGFNNPAQAQRLSSGNTLVADERGLHEIDRAGNEVWHFKVPRSRFCRY